MKKSVIERTQQQQQQSSLWHSVTGIHSIISMSLATNYSLFSSPTHARIMRRQYAFIHSTTVTFGISSKIEPAVAVFSVFTPNHLIGKSVCRVSIIRCMYKYVQKETAGKRDRVKERKRNSTSSLFEA